MTLLVRWSLFLALAVLPFPFFLIGGPMNPKVLAVAAAAVLAALIVDQMFNVSGLLS